MKYLGAHVSTSGGLYKAVETSAAIGAKAFALFTKNQKQWVSKAITEEEKSQFSEAMARYGYSPEHVLPHDSYLINMGNADPEKHAKSRDAFIDEMARCSRLGLKYLNFHPGSHLNEISEEECLDLISRNINLALADESTGNVMAVIEVTAGQGTNLGYRFEHIARIISNMDDKSRAGVCIDTCHIFAAGYDISTRDGFARVMEEFDRIIGINYLKGMHLNDAKKECGSRVDRHACIGEGFIGIEGFRYIMETPCFNDIPLILETPDPDRWADEIKFLYSMEK